MDNHFKYLSIAREVAQQSSYKQRVGAILKIDNRIFYAYNDAKKTHPESTSRDNHLHAEFSVIKKAINSNKGRADKLKFSSLYIYRIRRDGSSGLAKPCKECRDLIDKYKIRSVYYSDYNNIFCEL